MVRPGRLFIVVILILLIHRAIRDDQMCLEKYGDDWVEYKRQVPYMFIPNVIWTVNILLFTVNFHATSTY